MRLLEGVVVLLLGALMTIGVWRGAAAVRQDGVRLHDRAALRDAIRVASLLLDVEAGGFVGASGRPGEVAVRAHRWWGVSCDAVPRPGRAALAWRGLRRPDPAKDSLLLIAADGFAAVRALDRVSSSPLCAVDGIEVAWTARVGEPVPVAVRGFERGAYRVDDAFRYRRGRGGAQPLTAARLDPDSSRLEVGPGEVRLRIDPRPARRWSR